MNAANPSQSLFHLQPGGRLGKYVIVSELGRGGMAVVYQAHQPDLDRVVAIKVLFGNASQQRFVERFQAEARAVAKLSHPNVIRIHEVGEQDAIHFLVMEYIEGVDLLTYLHERKPSFDEVLEIVRQTAEALAYCHKQGIIHRDLKPTNILMRGNTPVVIDFGLAKAVDPQLAVTLTLSGEVVGSPAYMSPEQAMGQAVGVPSDICSLGIIMYELISFKNPYLDPRSLHQTALNAIRAEPVPLRYLTPWLDSEFAAVVHKTMAKEQRERYPSMDLLLKDIFNYQHGLPVSAKPPGPVGLAWRFVKANPVLYWGAGFLAVVAGLVGAFINIQEENKKAPWGLVQEENFSRPSPGLSFSSYDYAGGAWKPSTSWRMADGRLEAQSPGLSCAVSDQEFFGDIKIEFTVTGLDGSNGDFNAFLFGPRPEEAVRFSLGEWGGAAARIEAGRPGGFHFDDHPVRLSSGTAYKVTLEREGKELRLWLDDRMVARKWRTLPMGVDRNSKFGFYTWNARLAVGSIRIYKKAVAMSASPTVVADAYLEEGFIPNSIPAYRRVIEAYPGKAVSAEAHLKLGKCYMVQGGYAQALPELTEAASSSKAPDLVPEALYQLAQCYFRMDKPVVAFDKLKLVPLAYPRSEFNAVLCDQRLESVYGCLDDGEPPGACAQRMVEEFRFLIANEDPLRGRFGPAYVALVDAFRSLGYSAPLQHSLGLVEYFREDPEVAGGLLLEHVMHRLAKGDTALARRDLEGAGARAQVSAELRARAALLAAQVRELAGDFAGAAEGFASAYRAFGDVPGMPFRCLVHAWTANALAGRNELAWDRDILRNQALLRRDRMRLDWLSDPEAGDGFRRGLFPGVERPEVEDALVDFLKALNARGPAAAARCLSDRAGAFPPGTFERRYLDHTLAAFASGRNLDMGGR